MRCNVCRQIESKWRRRRGTVVLETALTLILFLTFLFAVFEYGRILMVKQLITNAARHGSRIAVSGTYARTSQEIETEVRRLLVGLDPDVVQVSLFRADIDGEPIGEWTDAQFGEYIAVSIKADIHGMLPSLGILPNPIKLHTLSIQHSEGD